MRILLISNNPLSNTGSNGRTMLNMLGHFKKDEILNFFVSGDNPAFESALFYRIKDIDVLKNKKPFGSNLIQEDKRVYNTKKSSKESVFKYFIRSLIWSKKSIKSELLTVALDFKPDRIVLQCGDSDFLINISVWLSYKIGIPLISYNSEDYIFKSWNYIEKKNHLSLFFKIFMKRLRKSYDSLYKKGKSFIYLTDSLKDLYLSKYPNHNALVIYNSSNLNQVTNYNKNGDIVYCGNVGVGRHKSLIDLSDHLYKKFNKKIKIYSQITDDSILNALKNCKTLNYVGNVSYSECVAIQKNSSFLIFVESFDEYYLKDTRNAFSTKIADSLMLGIPVIALLPESSFAFKYLSENECAIVASSLDTLNRQISLLDENKLHSIVFNAINTAEKNHNGQLNSNKFYEIICGE